MKQAVQDIREFHSACGVPTLERPNIPDNDRVALRMNLILEEVQETIKAMDEGNLVEIADGLADIIVVVIGTALEYGIPLPEVWNEVHQSNMAKVDPRTGMVRRREDGKILKPDGWAPPDIAGVLDAFRQ